MISRQKLEALALNGFKIDTFSDQKALCRVVVKAPDRIEMSETIRKRLTANKIPFQHGRMAGSSFPAVVFELDGKQVRITFKETRVPLDSKLTALMEACQCIYFAAYQHKRGPVDSQYVRDNINKFRSMFDISANIDQIWERLTPVWKKSHELTANHMSKKLRGGSFVFHHQSSLVKQFSRKFVELEREYKIFGGKEDNWNPADIWIVRRGTTPAIINIKSFDELNGYLCDEIDKNAIIPLSLKQTTRDPHLTSHNTNDDKSSKEPTHSTDFKKARVNTGFGNWTSSKNTMIEFSKGRAQMYFQFRQSSPGAAINGEVMIRRDTARHGKLKIQVIESIFRQLGVKLDSPDRQQLTKQSAEFEKELMDKTFTLGNKLADGQSISRADFDKAMEDKKSGKKPDPDWLASKYAAMLVIDAFEKLNNAKKQQAVEMMYSHGAAATALAGPFLKISQEAR